MIIVDSSVWIDYFNGVDTPEAERLHFLLGHEPVAIGDVILMELLQGFRTEARFRKGKEFLERLPVFPMLGGERAVSCAKNYRTLKSNGISVRKMANVIIATFCIQKNFRLLHADRDFEPFETYLGLRVVG